MMIHQPLGGFQGQAADMEIHAREMLGTRDRLNKILAKHTGQSVEKIKMDTDRDNFMAAADAIRYGLVDKMLEKRGELPEPRIVYAQGLSASRRVVRSSSV